MRFLPQFVSNRFSFLLSTTIKHFCRYILNGQSHEISTSVCFKQLLLSTFYHNIAILYILNGQSHKMFTSICFKQLLLVQLEVPKNDFDIFQISAGIYELEYMLHMEVGQIFLDFFHLILMSWRS